MTIFLQLFLFIIVIILQVTLAPLFSIKHITPDFVLIAVVYFTLKNGRIWGVIAGFTAGLLIDVLLTDFIGLSSLTNTIAAYAVGFLSQKQSDKPNWRTIGIFMIILLIHDLIYFTILTIDVPVNFWNTLFLHALPTSFYTLLFMIMIFLFRPKFRKKGLD
ncbi:MAG: rod shape-determining protein MreD [bacterium]